MTCEPCDEFWDRFWAQSDVWERNNETQIFPEESDKSWDLVKRAYQVAEDDPTASFRLYLEAAEGGSIYSMEQVGWHYWTGTGVAADPYIALKYYHRSICEGSWMARIGYARLLAQLGHHDDCEITLKDAVASGFVPAYYWLGWTRYARSKTSQTCRKVRPLIEYAADKGHPGAKLFLTRSMAFGHLGLHHIPRGWILLVQFAVSYALAEIRSAPA